MYENYLKNCPKKKYIYILGSAKFRNKKWNTMQKDLRVGEIFGLRINSHRGTEFCMAWRENSSKSGQ